MVGGGVTTIVPQPGLTAGAGGAGGKMITFTVLLAPQGSKPGVPAGMGPQAVDKTYLAITL